MFWINPKGLNNFKFFYDSVFKQLLSLEQFVNITVRAYEKELKTNKDSIKERYKSDLKKVEEGYNELISLGTEKWQAYEESNWKLLDDYIIDEEWKEMEFHDLLVQTLLNSSLISTISIIEYNLKKICELIKDENSYNISIEDFQHSNNYIGSSKKYLTKVAEIDFKNLIAEFDEIERYRFIRNKIIHNLGKIPKKEYKNIETLIAKHKKVSINSRGVVLINNPKFVIDLIDVGRTFFNKLFYIYEEKRNFKRLKENLNWFIDNFTNSKVKTSKVASSDLFKLKYKAKLKLDRKKYDIIIKISKSKKEKFEIFNTSEELTELCSSIESNKHIMVKNIMPYVSCDEKLLYNGVYS